MIRLIIHRSVEIEHDGASSGVVHMHVPVQSRISGKIVAQHTRDDAHGIRSGGISVNPNRTAARQGDAATPDLDVARFRQQREIDSTPILGNAVHCDTSYVYGTFSWLRSPEIRNPGMSGGDGFAAAMRRIV